MVLFHHLDPPRICFFGCLHRRARIGSKSLQGWSVPDIPQMAATCRRRRRTFALRWVRHTNLLHPAKALCPMCEVAGERCCTQRTTGFESLSTGEVPYLRQRLTMRKDLRVHNVHLCLREVNFSPLLALCKGLVPNESGFLGHANHPCSGRMEASVGKPAGEGDATRISVTALVGGRPICASLSHPSKA